MKKEIKESVEFLSRYLFKNFTENELNEVKESLSEILQERFNGHWYEDKPMKGQAYRSIRYRRFDKELDPVFDCLFKRCKNIFDEKFKFPFQDFTLWIDPGEVSCRFGDSIGNSHVIACFDLTKRQTEQRKEIFPDIKPQPQVADVFEFFIPSDVLNTNEEFEKQPQQQQQQQIVIENNHINNAMSHLTINDYFSCSPSSLSSSSFSSNASDGTCTPVSYYGDNNSERSETPSSLTNISLNELTATPPQNQQISTSPSKSNGGAYCGYVESYPYYYKLNRLYNALAIQKLQTEKFKKIMRNKQQQPQQYSQQSSPASKSPSTTPAPQTTTIATKTTSIQIPQQQRGQKTNKQNPTRRTYQQKSPPKQSTLVDAFSPITYQQYNHLTPPQFMIPNSYYPMVNNTDLLMPNVQNTLAVSSIVTTQTTTNDQTNSATNDNNNNNTLFDTMNWLRGPDLVKSKN